MFETKAKLLCLVVLKPKKKLSVPCIEIKHFKWFSQVNTSRFKCVVSYRPDHYGIALVFITNYYTDGRWLKLSSLVARDCSGHSLACLTLWSTKKSQTDRRGRRHKSKKEKIASQLDDDTLDAKQSTTPDANVDCKHCHLYQLWPLIWPIHIK